MAEKHGNVCEGEGISSFLRSRARRSTNLSFRKYDSTSLKNERTKQTEYGIVKENTVRQKYSS